MKNEHASWMDEFEAPPECETLERPIEPPSRPSVTWGRTLRWNSQASVSFRSGRRHLHRDTEVPQALE